MKDTAAPALSARQILLAVLLYTACAAAFFYRSFPFFNTAIIGPPQDNLFVYWSLWYGTESLLHHAFPFMHTNYIFYPEGISLHFSNYYYYGVALAVFLRGLLPLPAIYNLLTLHTFVVGGVSAACLIYYLCRDFRASLVGGFIFAFSPAHFSRSLEHLTLASLQLIPLFILFLVKSVREDKKSNIFWASLFMTLDALCDWNYLVYDFLFILFVSFFILAKYKKKSFPSLGRLFWVPVLVFAALSPLIVPMVVMGSGHTFVDQLTGHDQYVADLLGFFVPHPQHLLSSVPRIHSINQTMTGDDLEKSAYLGAFNLLLVAGLWFWTRKECGKYLLGLVAFMMLAMGSHPHVLGQALPFPFPYRVLQALPFFTQARCPVRIVVYCYIFLGILAAFSLKKLAGFFRSKIAAGMACVLVSLAVFFDFYPTAFAMAPITLPPCYRIIQADPDKNFGIFEIPWDFARYMMYQTIHGIPCVQGYMGRRVEKTLLDRISPYEDLRNPLTEKAMLIRGHAKYIVIHKKRMTWNKDNVGDELYMYVWGKMSYAYSVFFKKIYEDDSAAVFKVY